MAASGSNPNQDKEQASISPSPSDPGAVKRPQILVVDDNKADVFLIREAIAAASIDADLHVMSDGQAAVQFLTATDEDGNTPLPDLVLLDLNLPKVSGENVLRHLRNSERYGSVPVLVLTSSDSARERERVMELGIAHYFRKPSEYSEFLKLGGLVREILESRVNAL